MVGVLRQPKRKGATMATDHPKVSEQLAQEILLEDANFLREIVERVLQEMLEAEMTEHIGAAPYERSATRIGHRNGYKPRTLRTRVGTLNLLVPQDREGAFSTRLFSRYQRNEKALCLALMEMYVEGVSTRKVKEVTEELCGTSFSKSLVSELAGSLDSELSAWRDRRVEAEAYPYVFVDARYEKVRADGRVVSQGVLIVSGIRDDGYRELLGVGVADTESEATYHELFRSLKRRGLSEEGTFECATGGLRRPRGPKSGHRSPLPGSLPPEVPGPLRQEPPRHGGPRQAQGARGRPKGNLRRSRLKTGPHHRRFDRREMAQEEGQREGSRASRREHRGVPQLPGFPRVSPQAHPHHERAREAQPGDKASQQGGEDLSQREILPAPGYGAGGGAIGGVDHGQALPGHGRARRTLLRRGARSRGGDRPRNDEVRTSLEETTETSGLDLIPIPAAIFSTSIRDASARTK